MKVVVTGGGTAGHVTPLLAVASELKHQHPRAEIRYIGNVGDKFAHLADESDSIDGSWRILAGKFRRFHGVSKLVYVKDLRIVLRNIRDFFYFIIGFIQSIWLFIWWRPNVVFVKGGFVGLPVGLAAALLRIPIVTHDSDTLPGLTNRVLARFATVTAVAMPESFYSYPKHKLRHTGLPLRAEYSLVTAEQQTQAKQQLGIPGDAFVTVVVGGSLGAVRLNDAVMAIAEQYLAQSEQNWLVHLSGAHQAAAVQDFYKSLPPEMAKRCLTWAFREDLYAVTAAADVIISRAGSSIHELSVQQKAVILVPNPVLTGGHQTVNARAIASMQAAAVVTEKELSETQAQVLFDVLLVLRQSSQARAELAAALGQLAVPNATSKIVSVIVEAAR